MEFGTADAARWVRTIGFRVTIFLAVLALDYFSTFMRFFDSNFGVKNRCNMKYIFVDFGRSKIKVQDQQKRAADLFLLFCDGH